MATHRPRPANTASRTPSAPVELVASGAAGRALKVGDRAPAFALEDPDGELVASTALLARGPLVVTFYRGVWCPYCNMDLQALQAARPELERRGAGLVAISPQTAPNSRRSVREKTTWRRKMAMRAGRCRCRRAS